jgi:chemotaxis response regulator CheB
VHGMPGEAIKLNAATFVLPPEAIEATLVAVVRKANGRPL